MSNEGPKLKQKLLNTKATKRKKRRKNPDPAFRLGSSRSRPIDPSAFTVENLFKLNQSALSPAPKAVILNTTSTKPNLETQLFTPNKKHASTLISPSKVTLSTPDKGPFTRFVTTPLGSKLFPSRMIDCDDGAYVLFLSEAKINNQNITIPKKPANWIKQSPIPKASLKGFVDIKITKKQIQATEALIRKRKREGLAPRAVSQNKVMGIPANTALKKAGITADPNTMHWVHFISHSFIGDKSQIVSNLGLGTKYANMAMELVNPVIKRLLFKKGAYPAIYLSIIPEYVPGFEAIRLLKSLTMIIKDGKGDSFEHKASITFDMLTLQKVCLTDVIPVRKFIMQKFANKNDKTSQAKQATENSLQAPEEFLLHKAPLTPLYGTKSAKRRQALSPLSPSTDKYVNAKKQLKLG
ncbi:MAG: hypothetical protein AB7V32_06560 [Candidatus Berkiella sp.]